MTVAARLLHEDDLVHTRCLILGEVRSHVVGRPDAGRLVGGVSRRLDDLFGSVPAQLLELLPELRATGNCVVSDKCTQCVAEGDPAGCP